MTPSAAPPRPAPAASGPVGETAADREMAALGLTDEEIGAIRRTLGRAPTRAEAAAFSALWSEHCAYKHSRRHLRRLPRTGAGAEVLVGPGENAGVVALDARTAIAFKIESHNHPSAVDPHQGAATGVGGILRDILASGARPIALLDSIHFGPPDGPAGARARRLLRGVVAGIADYGNCVGVPTVAGETRFAASYAGNPLVNVMAVGLLPRERLARPRAAAGRDLLYYGGATGRDGMGGAAFASVVLSGEDRRPSVQVADPFTGKRILEATIDLLDAGVLEGLQDMGAAGLTCAAAEMAARGGCGVRLDLDAVPYRAAGMTAVEILLSESQERMLGVVAPGRWDEAERILALHGLAAHRVGATEAGGRFVVVRAGRVEADVPVAALVEAPERRVEAAAPADLTARGDVPTVPDVADPNAALLALLAHPEFAPRDAIRETFDSMVGTRTILRTLGGDAAVLRVDGSDRAIAVSVDSCARAASLDPRRGAALAVCEGARNVACAGGRPAAITNGLNLGDPGRPDVAWALAETVEGIAEAARWLSLPVTGGNVSLYNESGDGPIDPTAVIGMLGILESPAHALGISPARRGAAVVLLLGPVRTPAPTIAASAYLEIVHGRRAGRPAAPDLVHEAALCDLLFEAARRGLLVAAHDISDGGAAVALSEVARACGAGIEIALPAAARADDALFGEAPGRALVLVRPEDEAEVRRLAERRGVAVLAAGRLGGDRLRIRPGIDLAVAEATAVGAGVIDRLLGEIGA